MAGRLTAPVSCSCWFALMTPVAVLDATVTTGDSDGCTDTVTATEAVRDSEASKIVTVICATVLAASGLECTAYTAGEVTLGAAASNTAAQEVL